MRRYKDITVTARGIPALARVSVYEPGKPAIIGATVDSSHPPDPGDLDYELLDSRGRAAPWLARGMTRQDWDYVEDQVYDYFQQEAAAAAEYAAERHGERYAD